MDEYGFTNLDVEFKRYLQILRPYLGQLIDQDVIEICNAWIQRLSDSGEKEKGIRNKYVFALCYQLARGVLEEPFMNAPTNADLSPLSDELNSDNESSTENECIVIDADEDSNLHYTKTPRSETIESPQEYKTNIRNCDIEHKNHKEKATHQQTILCYTCPEVLRKYDKVECNDEYAYRANNLIQKLREIKTQNILLSNELNALKEDSKTKPSDFLYDSITKVDTATSVCIDNTDSSATLKSLKSKLQEIQDSRNALIESIAELQDKLDHFNEIKQHDIEEIEAKHKLEVIKLKTVIREETKEIYEKKLEEVKNYYEATIKEIQDSATKEIDIIVANKDNIISDKNKLLDTKDLEITRLRNQIEEQKIRIQFILNKFIDKPNEEVSHEIMKEKALQLQKRLNKMEKSKSKCAKVYEAKLASLQREKHLAECSLQLQLIRQRAQLVNEVNNETQVELTTALDKLETKYKEIVATVQATAIQRRMQDQVALDSILQAACGDRNQSYDNEMTTSLCGHKVGNRSFGDESLGFCLNSDRMGELFEKVYIPQRDGEPLK
ncbi:hypothetical protein K1T71_001594 [Dendrolimus kikuchii]|uniref:Uncharacterized protein n=1 Tax=Dendrolimus kikuchii TaxID=765133 RepID=A0ACC1DEH9_9NEOP|nr:hypothetical protein K1T71_001594 [Dendrolimus kikuchii]